MRQPFLVTFVCNTVERKRYVVESFKANPFSSRILGGWEGTAPTTSSQPNRVGLYAAIKFSRNGPKSSVSGVPTPKVFAPPPSDSVWSVDSGKSLKLSPEVRSLHHILFRLGQWALPQPTSESVQRSFSTGGATGGLGVTPLFEIYGFHNLSKFA